MKKTLIIGTIQEECLEYVKELPKGNENYDILSTKSQFSGSALKAAQVWQRFGFPFTLIAPIGQGIVGDHLADYMAKNELYAQRIEGIHGTSTLLVDQHDNATRIYAPGVEYNISNNLFLTIEPNEFDCVLLFGDALISQDAFDVIDLLAEIDKDIFFAPGHYFQAIDNQILNKLLFLKPVMILEDTDLLLEHFQYLEQVISGLQKDSQNTIIFLAQKKALYSFTKKEKFILNCTKYLDSEYLNIAYCLAKIANIDDKNALLYAQKMAIQACHHQVLDVKKIDQMKDYLKEIILYA